MNFSEFKKLLGADPWNRDPETLRARHSAPEFEQAAEDAEAFERKLQAALEAPVDESLAEDLIGLVERTATRRGPPRWLAVAATVILAAGAVSVIWLQNRQPQDVHVYVAQHLSHDGATLMARAGGPVDASEVQRILARFGVGASPQLTGRVRLIKFCPTPDGRGAHMILATDSGPVHLIYMPETPVKDGEEFHFDGMLTHLVSLEKGAAVLVGAEAGSVDGLDKLVRDSILPLQTEA